jgi:hypothetical protein
MQNTYSLSSLSNESRLKKVRQQALRAAVRHAASQVRLICGGIGQRRSPAACWYLAGRDFFNLARLGKTAVAAEIVRRINEWVASSAI